MKKIGCIGHDCAACAAREKHINKLKQDIERWKSRATTYKKQAEQLRDRAAAAWRGEVMREALVKLAKLGNEPYYGSSIGNQIARDALAKVGAGDTVPMGSNG